MAADPFRPATDKQKALMLSLGIAFDDGVTVRRASDLIEAHTRELSNKAARRDPYYNFNGEDGFGAMFKRPTKAEIQQVVTYLDIHKPGWDLDHTSDVFVAAGIQQLFPHRVKKGHDFQFPASKDSAGRGAGCLGLLLLVAMLALLHKTG